MINCIWINFHEINAFHIFSCSIMFQKYFISLHIYTCAMCSKPVNNYYWALIYKWKQSKKLKYRKRGICFLIDIHSTVYTASAVRKLTCFDFFSLVLFYHNSNLLYRSEKIERKFTHYFYLLLFRINK